MDERAGICNRQQQSWRRTAAYRVLLGLSLLLSSGLGCSTLRPRCALEPDVELPILIGYLNENSSRMQSWQCKDVKISMQGGIGLAPSLSASMSVDRQRKFRLIADSPVGNEVDLGSNPERFWFWVRRAEGQPGVYTCRHEDVRYAQSQMPLPFEPDWLIECLGVVPIDPEEVTWEKHPTNPKLAFLKRPRRAPNGEDVELRSMVDTCKGVILQHSLVDSRGQTIARAELNEYLVNKDSNVRLPHTIVLEWPQERVGLKLRLGGIIVNPHVPQHMYAVPNMPQYPVYDLGLAGGADRAHEFQQTAEAVDEFDSATEATTIQEAGTEDSVRISVDFEEEPAPTEPADDFSAFEPEQ